MSHQLSHPPSTVSRFSHEIQKIEKCPILNLPFLDFPWKSLCNAVLLILFSTRLTGSKNSSYLLLIIQFLFRSHRGRLDSTSSILLVYPTTVYATTPSRTHYHTLARQPRGGSLITRIQRDSTIVSQNQNRHNDNSTSLPTTNECQSWTTSKSSWA